MSKETTTKSLAECKPLEVAALPMVAEKFKSVYRIFHGKDSEKYYEAEKFHFMKLLSENQNLQQCTPMSLYGVFLDAAVHGISFDPTLKHCYLVPYGQKAQLMISGYGELMLRTNCGQIKYADNPVLVYEGDVFKHGTRNNQVYVDHEAVLPRTSDNIIACYLRITRPDDTIDYKVLSMEEVMKLKEFSKQKNSLAWTTGLPGMVQAKTIKHAFRSYPKLRILQQTKNTLLANDAEDAPELADLYDLEAVNTDTGEITTLASEPTPAPSTNSLSDF